MYKFIYASLFCLSIVLINPFGIDRGGIWTQPKILAVELICILNIFIFFENEVKLSKTWKIVACLWGIFLIIGVIATINSPLPLRSLLGQSTMKDGLLYWGLIAVFTLSNALVLKLKPEIGRSQIQGLLIGGVILALSIFPQMLNWHIDYTVTMGNLINTHILKSTIFQGHQPIGLYSHRGHTAFVLAVMEAIALCAYRNYWLNIKQFVLYSTLIIPALICTQTRAGLLAFIISAAYILGKKRYKLIIIFVLSFVLIISIFSINRQIKDLPLLKKLTSDRIYLWEMSVKRIQQRPLIGWGFDGFEIAYPYRPDGQIRTDKPISSKSHNLILDSAISVGIIGTVAYLVLITFCFYLVLKSSIPGIVAVALTYLIYTLTWYECAQFTHIFWWSLSFFDYEKISSSNSLGNQLSVTNFRSMDTRVRGWFSRAKARIFK